MTQTLPTMLAYYGKLPARGDFVGRRLPRETIALWDDWLQQAIAASRQAVGDGWLDLYLVSPLWRFLLPAGLCGGAALAGVLMPSVDKVGRAFPLMLAADLGDGADFPSLLAGGGAWFAAVEERALAALAEDFVLDRLDAPLAPLSLTSTAVPARPIDPGSVGHCVLLGDGADPSGLAGYGHRPGRSLWWTTGSARVAPVLVLARGLPAPEGFAAFIDGDWAGRGWSVAAQPDSAATGATTSGAPPVLEAELLPWDRGGLRLAWRA